MNNTQKVAFWDERGYVCFYALSDTKQENPIPLKTKDEVAKGFSQLFRNNR